MEPTLRGEEIDPRPADSGWLWLWSCFVSCSYLPLFFVVVSRKVAFVKDWKIDGNILESNKWGFLMNNKTPQVQWETKWSLASFLFILCFESTYLYEKILANCAFNESNISEACFKPKKKHREIWPWICVFDAWKKVKNLYHLVVEWWFTLVKGDPKSKEILPETSVARFLWLWWCVESQEKPRFLQVMCSERNTVFCIHKTSPRKFAEIGTHVSFIFRSYPYS